MELAKSNLNLNLILRQIIRNYILFEKKRMLIDLYEKCGDAIAQQYAGSQLVHRVDTYGKNSLGKFYEIKMLKSLFKSNFIVF